MKHMQISHFIPKNINYAIVLRFIGWLLNIEAAFMLLPMAVAFAYGEQHCALMFLLSAGITGFFGVLMTLIKPRSMVMQSREGLLLTAMVWVAFSLFGMLPFLLTHTLTSVTDAYFECMSGFTTTGATVITNVDATSHGILFWRALMQWIGGMGIILFTLAVLPMFNYRGGIAMFNAEVTGITKERLRPRVSQSAMSLWALYIIISIVMALMLWAGPMNWFDSLCHTMATVSTGGFSTHTAGLFYYDDYYTKVVILIFMFLCGVNFTVLYRTLKGDVRALGKNDIFKCYAGTVAFFSIIVAAHICFSGNTPTHNLFENVVDGFFDVVSAITSTGFSDYDYEKAGGFVSLVLMISMFFGSSAGSTAGGAKIDRMLVMLKNIKNEFYRALHPNAVTAVRISDHALSQTQVNKVMAFLTVYVLLILFSAAALSLMGLKLFDAAFTSMSAISNIGLGYGITGINSSFAALPCAGKWLVCFDMLVGRLELFTVLVLFTRNFWVKD